MVDRRINPGEYRVAQLAARAQEGALDNRSARIIVGAIRRYGDDVSRIVGRIPATPSETFLRRSAEEFRRAANRLERALNQAIRANRTLTFREVQAIWRQSGLDAARAAGVPSGLLGAVRRPSITLLGAYEGIGASNWRTLLKGYVGAAATEVDQIVSRALLEGVSPEVLARRLRPYVQGSEPFRSAFRGLGIDPRRLTDPAVRGSARRMNFNARRIAVSEIHNARSEAEVQHFAADPLVGAVFWRLAPDRGPTARADSCDVLASSNLYGLGVGVYPVDAVPLTPHPHDRCERVPRVRSRFDAETPKPMNLIRTSALSAGVINRRGVTRVRGARIRQEAEQLLVLTDTRAPSVLELTQ